MQADESTADYLRKQAETCLLWARDCFDLRTSERLRLMARDFQIKAGEVEKALRPQGVTRSHAADRTLPPSDGALAASDDAS